MPETKKVVLRFKGKPVGVHPNGKQLYHDGDNVGGYETAVLTKHADGRFDVYYGDADVQLSMNDKGGLETRPKGQHGGWELFRAAEQPPDFKTILLWNGDHGPKAGVLEVEAL